MDPIKSLKPQMVKNFSKDKNKIYNKKQNQQKKRVYIYILMKDDNIPRLNTKARFSTRPDEKPPIEVSLEHIYNVNRRTINNKKISIQPKAHPS